MPYEPDFAGQELAGVTAGLIVRFSGEDNFDSLASCIADQETLTSDLTAAVEGLMARYNADILDSVQSMEEIVNTLDKNVAGCKQSTKDQVKSI